VVVALATLSVAGCSKSPTEQARQELASLHSWAASARMVGDEWIRQAVPDAYATLALRSFGKRLRKERQRVSSQALPEGVSGFLGTRLAAVEGLTDSLRAAIRRDDRGRAAGVLTLLSAQVGAADSMRSRFPPQ
jgi:hypothetical protein